MPHDHVKKHTIFIGVSIKAIEWVEPNGLWLCWFVLLHFLINYFYGWWQRWVFLCLWVKKMASKQTFQVEVIWFYFRYIKFTWCDTAFVADAAPKKTHTQKKKRSTRKLTGSRCSVPGCGRGTALRQFRRMSVSANEKGLVSNTPGRHRLLS